MNEFEKIIERVQNGAHCNVDFKKRTVKVNKKLINVDPENLGIEFYADTDEWLDKLEDLYDDYKYSKPTKTSAARERRSYFKALNENELIKVCGRNALSVSMDRDEAQARLELFILFSLINGSLKPDELFAKDWYFQGTDKSLVLPKNWF